MEDLVVAGERICEHLGIDPSSLPAEGLARVHETADKQRVRRWAARLGAAAPTAGEHRGLAAQRRAPPSTPAQPCWRPRPWSGSASGSSPEMEALRPWLPDGHDGWGLLAG